MPLEKEVERTILEYLNSSKLGFFFKINTGGIWDAKRQVFRKPHSKFIIKGVSDILGILNDGRMVAIEVKRKQTKNQATEDQLRFLHVIEMHGGVSGVAWDVESAVAIIQNAMCIH